MTTSSQPSLPLWLRLAAAALFVLAVLLLSIVAGAGGAFAQMVVSGQPLPEPAPHVATITLWRDGGILAAIVVGIAALIWRASLIEGWVRSQISVHGLVAALVEDELTKRGVVVHPKSVPPAMPDAADYSEAWAAEADKAAPPQVANTLPPRRAVRNDPVPSTKDVAAAFAPRRTKGEKVQ